MSQKHAKGYVRVQFTAATVGDVLESKYDSTVSAEERGMDTFDWSKHKSSPWATASLYRLPTPSEVKSVAGPAPARTPAFDLTGINVLAPPTTTVSLAGTVNLLHTETESHLHASQVVSAIRQMRCPRLVGRALQL